MANLCVPADLTAGSRRSCGLWLVILVRPGKFPPIDEANQWAAEAAVIGAGALFFAVVATAIATVAYINSTEKPDSKRLTPAATSRSRRAGRTSSRTSQAE